MKLKRLLTLLIPVLLFSSCAESVTLTPNSFDGVRYAQTASANSVVIDDVVINNPENVKTVQFSSRHSSYLDGDTLHIGIGSSIEVEFDERFTNIENVYVTAVDCPPAIHGKELYVDMMFRYPSIKNVYILPTGKRQKAYSRPVKIHANFSDSVVSNFYAHVKNWYDDKVEFQLNCFKTTANTNVFIGRNASIFGADLTEYKSLHIEKNGIFEGDYFGLNEENLFLNSSIQGKGGYYTGSMHNYLTTNIPSYVFSGYMWKETGRDDYPWQIVPETGPRIDGLKILHPENITVLYLVSDSLTRIEDHYLYLNVTSSKSVYFDSQFSSLKIIYAGYLFDDLAQDPKTNVYVDISVNTPSLKEVNFSFFTNSSDDFIGKIYIDIDLNNASLDYIRSDYTSGYGFVYINLRNFTTSKNNNGIARFGRNTNIFNALVKEYNSLFISNNSKIISGYYDLASDATVTLNGDHNACGGFYTDAFKNYAELNNQNFVEVGFDWEETDDGNYPWTIGGTPLFDGIPIYSPENIRELYLTQEFSRVEGDILYLDVNKDVTFTFDSSFSSLEVISSIGSFSGVYKNVNIDLLFKTTSLTTVDLGYYSHGFISGGIININFDFNGQDLNSFGCGLGKGSDDLLYLTFDNFSINQTTDTDIFYIDNMCLEFNNCNFLNYKTLNPFKIDFCKINSGYYDLHTIYPGNFRARGAGYGGYYTQELKEFFDTNQPDFVADGYTWLETGRDDFEWTIKSTTLHPTKDEIEAELYDMTTIEDNIIHAFGYQIAYSYGYEGQKNRFQIQVSFDYQSILDYFYYIFESWGNTELDSVDLLQIRFYTSQYNYMMYDLLHNKLYSCSISSQTQVLIDDNPKLVDSPLVRGFKIITLDLGDLTGADSSNIAKTFQTELYIRISDPVNLHVEFFNSKTHRPNSDEPVNHSFAYLLNRYLDPTNPIYPQFSEEQLASLRKCKQDLGIE